MIKTTKLPRNHMVRVTFALPAGEPSGGVSVVGDFNDWNPYAHPLRLRSNRTRSASVTVPAGSTLRFRYLGEGGSWFDDDTVPAHGDQGATITVLSGRGRVSRTRPGPPARRPRARHRSLPAGPADERRLP
jgi:hypothetical protein